MGRLLLGAFSYSTNNALSYFQRFDSFYIGHCYLLHSSLGIGRNKGRLLSIFKKDGICSIGFVRHPNPYRYDNRYQKKYIKHSVIKYSNRYNRIGIFCLVFQLLILQVKTKDNPSFPFKTKGKTGHRNTGVKRHYKREYPCRLCGTKTLRLDLGLKFNIFIMKKSGKTIGGSFNLFILLCFTLLILIKQIVDKYDQFYLDF